MVWVMAAMAVASAVMAAQQDGNAELARAEEFGRKAGELRASAEIQRGRAAFTQAAQKDKFAYDSMSTETQAQEIQAQIASEASFAGVKGQSIEDTKQMADANAARVKQGLAAQRRSGLLQIQQSLMDIDRKEYQQRGELDLSGAGNQLKRFTDVVGTGLSAYASTNKRAR